MLKDQFKNKVVVITGGASGIGAAIGKRFGSEGSRIALLDMNDKAVKAEIRSLKKHGIDAVGFKCDVSVEKECKSAIKEVIARYGGIDVFVNNAGITQRSLFIDTKISVYRKILDVNFFGSLYCTMAAVKSLIERKGFIIVTSSIAGFTPLFGRTGYCASKHALHGFFESLRTELKETGVDIMLVCPGFTSTNLQSSALDGYGKINRRERIIPGKEASPESVAEAVYKGLLKKKRILILTPVGKAANIIKKFLPALYEWLMIKNTKSGF